MANKRAGAKYPHATTDRRPHNHQMCPVVTKIAEAAEAGTEQWGTRHEWPVRSEDLARKAKQGFYAARYCRDVTRLLGEPVSVQADAEQDGDTWRVWVRVWPRSVARREIARRVRAGERLAYNVMRSALCRTASTAAGRSPRRSIPRPPPPTGNWN